MSGDPGAYARPDPDSPLAALLDAYVEASVNHYLASKGLFHGTLAKRDVHAVRAAILAEFATVEVERGYWHEEARRYAQNVDFWRDKADAGEEGWLVRWPGEALRTFWTKNPQGFTHYDSEVVRVRVVRVEEGTP